MASPTNSTPTTGANGTATPFIVPSVRGGPARVYANKEAYLADYEATTGARRVLIKKHIETVLGGIEKYDKLADESKQNAAALVDLKAKHQQAKTKLERKSSHLDRMQAALKRAELALKTKTDGKGVPASPPKPAQPGASTTA